VLKYVAVGHATEINFDIHRVRATSLMPSPLQKIAPDF